ncbi:MAG: hypothetical protein HC895_04345 [Leptolyngbyaceae cyanobacterium SM1_3_5]|nr:hypothetical protein [Leptolyngbyaceae cyanobacterium SM1_3_5]
MSQRSTTVEKRFNYLNLKNILNSKAIDRQQALNGFVILLLAFVVWAAHFQSFQQFSLYREDFHKSSADDAVDMDTSLAILAAHWQDHSERRRTPAAHRTHLHICSIRRTAWWFACHVCTRLLGQFDSCVAVSQAHAAIDAKRFFLPSPALSYLPCFRPIQIMLGSPARLEFYPHQSYF